LSERGGQGDFVRAVSDFVREKVSLGLRSFPCIESNWSVVGARLGLHSLAIYCKDLVLKKKYMIIDGSVGDLGIWIFDQLVRNHLVDSQREESPKYFRFDLPQDYDGEEITLDIYGQSVCLPEMDLTFS